MTDPEGKLSSMGYPAAYSNDAHCQWNIRAPEGKLVHLHFEAFSLEDSQLCLSDSVALSDQIGSLGVSSQSPAPCHGGTNQAAAWEDKHTTVVGSVIGKLNTCVLANIWLSSK